MIYFWTHSCSSPSTSIHSCNQHAAVDSSDITFIWWIILCTCTICTRWTRRKLCTAIKALVFANRPCKRASSTRLSIGYNPRLKIGIKIIFRESYELKFNFRGFYFHRYATFPRTISNTIHIQFFYFFLNATKLTLKIYIYIYSIHFTLVSTLVVPCFSGTALLITVLAWISQL